MGAVCYGTITLSHAYAPGAAVARVADIVLGIPAGAISFYLVAAALRVPEVAEARDKVMRRVRGGQRDSVG